MAEPLKRGDLVIYEGCLGTKPLVIWKISHFGVARVRMLGHKRGRGKSGFGNFAVSLLRRPTGPEKLRYLVLWTMCWLWMAWHSYWGGKEDL